MKKYILGVVAVALGLIGTAGAAYQQQGFNQYTENSGGISFWCQQSCVILLGDVGSNDNITVEGGSHQGDGQRGYGYLVGQQIYAATVVPAKSYEWSFSDDPIYKQLPAGEKQVVFLVSGPLKADNIHVTMKQRSTSERFSWGWQRFRNTENIAPYSINLHYGPMAGNWSWPILALALMIISVVVIYVVRRKDLSFGALFNVAIGTLIVLMVIGGVRLLVDDIRITSSNSKEYQSDKQVFDLGNYISVTEKVRNYLDLDNRSEWKDKTCSIYAKSNMDWPHVAHWGSVYLRPCHLVQTGSMADYQLYYNVLPQNSTGSVVLSGDNFTLFNTRP